MRTFAKIFGRSPFVPLRAHLEQVNACVETTIRMFEAFGHARFDEVETHAAAISKLEHEADEVKHDIQDHLPRGLFLPVDRARFLEILATQDRIADRCENLGVQLTLKNLRMLPALREQFERFLAKNVEAFHAVRSIVEELDELLETGFGGAEAEQVKQMVADVSFKEHEADLIQRALLKQLYASEADLSAGDFYLWSQIIRQVSELSNLSEQLANRVRVTLELK